MPWRIARHCPPRTSPSDLRRRTGIPASWKGAAVFGFDLEARLGSDRESYQDTRMVIE